MRYTVSRIGRRHFPGEVPIDSFRFEATNGVAWRYEHRARQVLARTTGGVCVHGVLDNTSRIATGD
jgi:hypothetical protein